MIDKDTATRLLRELAKLQGETQIGGPNSVYLESLARFQGFMTACAIVTRSNSWSYGDVFLKLGNILDS
jgi:hypothetical protein